MDPQTIYRRRWGILSVLVLCLLVVILDNTILNVALKTIQEDLDASQSQLEWAVNSYTLVFAGLMFTAGILGDRFGRRLFLIAGLLLFGGASALSAWSGSADRLIATRALMGIGAAMVQPQTLSIITNVFPARERGKAIGVWAGFSGLAIALGPVTGGFLLEHFWWGSVFLVNVPFVIVGAVLLGLFVPESRDPSPQRIDPLGVLLSVAGLTALVYGIVKGGNLNDWTAPQVTVPIVGGIVLLAVFAMVERRSSHPSLDVSLFRKPAFSAATVSIGLTFFAMMGATFYMTFYLQAVRGYAPLPAGALVVPVSIAIGITAPLSSRFVRRFGTKSVVTVGMLVTGLALGSYFFVGRETPIWMLEVIVFTMGLGMGNVMAPATSSIMGTVPKQKAGAGSAVNNTIRMVGGALGVAILGSVLSANYRSSLGDQVNVLPAAARHDAGESIGGTLDAAGKLAGAVKAGQAPPQVLAQLPNLVDAAKDSFVQAMHVTSAFAFVVVWCGAFLAARFLPGKRAEVAAGDAEYAAEQKAMADGKKTGDEPLLEGDE